ncbi:hypothetical protein HF325_000092 [Metschnikowia pulcherrima]|uniref:Allantoate permease n=1 Tax=Metschnikowia pulcherrima TaxID=27326 RepID=A0A8H7LEG7_9ASCO|nr:hypothetical protein HF325_000092 [Metschnikowia pulcherrima]
MSEKQSEKHGTIYKVESIASSPDENVTKKVVGLDLFQHADEISDEEMLAELARIRRKVDWRIMPVLCITYTLQFLDKLSLNYALAYSLKDDLGLTGQRYSWVAAIFNFGYLFWAFPSNWIIQKMPVAKYTAGMLVTWAVILVAHIGATNYGGMLALRFILGMFEAGISPTCMMICGMFYLKKDQPFRMCTFLSCNGIATVLGALLGFGLGHADSGALQSWKLIFLTIGVKDERFIWLQAFEAFKDIQVYVFALIGLACGVINGGVSNFQLSLIAGFGFGPLAATALQMPTGAIEFVVVFSCGILALKVPNIRCVIFCGLCVPGLAGLIGIHLIEDNRWALVGCTWLQYIIGGPVILCWIFMNANIAGSTKKTVTTGLWFMIYAAGNIIGANIFFAEEKPKYTSAMTGLMTSYAGMIALGIGYYFLCKWRNHKRELEQGEYTEEVKKQAMVDGFAGKTDFENRGFRYSL